jgi:hypothetical protein
LAQSEGKQSVIFILSTPTHQSEDIRGYVEHAKEELIEEIPFIFNKFCTAGGLYDDEWLTFEILEEVTLENLGHGSLKARRSSVRKFLNDANIKKFFEKKKINYLIVTSISILPGEVWEVKWAFAKLGEYENPPIDLDKDFHTFTNPINFYMFCTSLPENMAIDFESFIQPLYHSVREAQRTKVLVTSCFYHRAPDAPRKEILDKLQQQMPSLLAHDLKKTEIFENFEVIPYDSPQDCGKVSDELYQKIIISYDADYLISAYMDMRKNMNHIYFTIKFIPKTIFKKGIKDWTHPSRRRFDAQVVSRNLAGVISENWPEIFR